MLGPILGRLRVRHRLRHTLVGGAGGVRRRAAEAAAPSAGSAGPRGVKRGIRQRLVDAPEPPDGGDDVPGADEAPDLPLNKSLRRDWARGALSSPKVLEYAAGASTQGASNIEHLAKGNVDARHAHRTVVRALGCFEFQRQISCRGMQFS